MTKNLKITGTSVLLISHSFFWLATNLIAPFFSIFAIHELSGVGLAEVGISSLIYYLSFGLLEPVVGYFSDKIEGLKDDLFLVIFGYILRGSVFLLFAGSTTVGHLYLLQLLLGLTRAISGPSEKVLFSLFIKRNKQATLWGIDESLINLSAAIGAGVGGYLISILGFRVLLVVTGILTIFAGTYNFLLIKYLKNRMRDEVVAG